MQTDWTIRDELIYLSQRWPYLVLAFLVGSLLGWGLVSVLPSSYEAQTVWYVAVNGDAEPRNPDDFKNWQLLQLEAFLLSDPVLAETANRLGETDLQELANRLETRWRNAGQWVLAARGGSAEQAQETAAAWAAAGLEQLTAAAGYAQEMLNLERSLRQARNDLSLLTSRQAVLEQASQSLQDSQTRLQNLPPDVPIDELERWNLALIAGQALDNDPAAGDLLAQMPTADAPASDYAAFLRLVETALAQQQVSLEARIGSLQAAYETDASAWQAAERSAHGISAFLTVEPLQEGEITVTPRQNPGLAALVGGILALIGLFLYRLAVRSR